MMKKVQINLSKRKEESPHLTPADQFNSFTRSSRICNSVPGENDRDMRLRWMIWIGWLVGSWERLTYYWWILRALFKGSAGQEMCWVFSPDPSERRLRWPTSDLTQTNNTGKMRSYCAPTVCMPVWVGRWPTVHFLILPKKKTWLVGGTNNDLR